MGLVNELLEDLYRRRVSPDDHPASPLSNIEVPARELTFKNGVTARSGANYHAPIGLGLIALTCVVVIALTATFPNLGQDVATNVRPSVSARPPVEFAAQDWANLTGLEVEATEDYTRLRIFLSKEREYWIQGDPATGEVEIVITRTRLTQPFSPDLFAGSGLSLQESHNSSIGLHLLLSLESASQIQSQFVDDGVSPQLILDVLPNPATSHSDDAIEGPARSIDTAVVPVEPLEPVALDPDWGTITQSSPRLSQATQEAHRSLDRARNLMARDRPKEAISEYIRAISFDPGLHQAREAVVGLLIEAGKLSAAERHLAAGLKGAPSHSPYNLLRARLLASMGQSDLAIAILESLPLPPQRRSDSLNLLAALHQQKGNHGRAEALFRSAVRISPHEGRLWMGLGISLEGQQRAGEALTAYKQAESLADFEIGPRRWLRSRIRDLSTVE